MLRMLAVTAVIGKEGAVAHSGREAKLAPSIYQIWGF